MTDLTHRASALLSDLDGFSVAIDAANERADIILNRPPLNVISMGARDQLRIVFEALDDEDKSAAMKRRPIDFKTYGIGAQILRDVGVGKMRVLSNPRKLGSMSGYGLEVTGFIAMPGSGDSPPCTGSEVPASNHTSAA